MAIGDELILSRGRVQLPIFLPVATRGFVKAVPMNKINELGITALISNSVHLAISPGIETLERSGGINGYTKFSGDYFTDSGGFQIIKKELVKVSDAGITFRDRKSGKKIFVSPEYSSEIQAKIRSSVAMMLDDCPSYGDSLERIKLSVKRTYEWGRIFSERRVIGQKKFGIIQGGFDPELRRESAKLMTSLDFDGFAIGGLKIGEPTELTDKILIKTLPLIPEGYPIYLMGVGDPLSIYRYSYLGVDIFDSTYPTRNARHGFALTSGGPVNLKNAKYMNYLGPIDDSCDCEACRNYSRSELREMYRNEDPSFQYLVTIHNLTFMNKFMEFIRNQDKNVIEIASKFSKINNLVNHSVLDG
ncbi:MAG: tRNA guanosine(34) transglycosylase Tgt [Thermoplasmatales archaeon]